MKHLDTITGHHEADVVVAGGGRPVWRPPSRPRGVDIRRLQQGMIRQGAYLDLPARKGTR